MTCGYCGSRNAEGEHRCRRCGRRPEDTLTGEFTLPRLTGAAAPQLQPRQQPEAEAAAVPRASTLAHPVQGSLFPVRSQSNVIPFEAYAPPKPAPRARPKAQPATNTGTRVPPKPAVRRTRVPDTQERLDFLPPAPPAPRTLGTTVEAVIYCDAPVATAVHRAVAGAFDWAMVLIAYGLLLALSFDGRRNFAGSPEPDGFWGYTPAGGVHVRGHLRPCRRGNTGDALDTPSAHHFRGVPARTQAAPPALRRVVPQPVHGTGAALVACGRRVPDLAGPYSRTFPTPREVDSQVLLRR